MTVARLWYMDRPKWGRSCRDCRTYQYDEATGLTKDDRRKSHAGLPMMRPKGADPPCHECPKTIGLATRHWRALGDRGDPPAWCYTTFRHWRELAATGFSGAGPAAADRVVRRNAAMFAAVERDVQTGRSEGVLALFGMMASR